MIGYWGTYSIETPEPYSEVAGGLVRQLGIDVASFPKYLDRKLYASAGRVPKIFFDKETFGVDRLVDDPYPFPGGETYDLAVPGPEAWEHFLAEAPMAQQARKDFHELSLGKKDYLPSLTREEKENRLAHISYEKFLTEIAGVHTDVARLYQTISQPLFGVGIEAVAALDAAQTGYPGFDGMGFEASDVAQERKYFFHFPDGNASIARLLVRSLVPSAIPGHSATDIVAAKADYTKLHKEPSPIRIRLNSSAVRVRHIGDVARAKEVEVAYALRDKVYMARAKNVILACWNAVIPYICDELPEKQKKTC